MDKRFAVIIGAGPAGLGAAYELAKRGLPPIVLEKAEKVGGLSLTENYKSYRFDIGGHRFFTKVPEVKELWQELLGNDLLKVRRLSRIYYRERFFNYPLEFSNTMSQLGLVDSLLILLSYIKAQLFPYPQEDTCQQWFSNRFGRYLYEMFFRAYTEKVWGIPCDMIEADWAAQRIRGLSLRTAVSNALFHTGGARTLTREFLYPILGAGMMWRRFQEAVEGLGGLVRLGTEVVRLERDGERIISVLVKRDDKVHRIEGSHFISSMPLTELIARMDPSPPADVVEAARKLRYRALILVGLVVDRAELFPDNWVYVHVPEVKVARIQNFKNWSPAMVPDSSKTSLGMEYFCTEGDDTWRMPDDELLDLAVRDLATLRMAASADVEDGIVFREPKAYPVYGLGHREHLDVVRGFLATMHNLQTVGRDGMHHYDNQDHSMLSGMLAARNLLGENHDLWNLDAERFRHEETLV